MNANIIFSSQITVHFTSTYKNHFLSVGKKPPSKAHDINAGEINQKIVENTHTLRDRIGSWVQPEELMLVSTMHN